MYCLIALMWSGVTTAASQAHFFSTVHSPIGSKKHTAYLGSCNDVRASMDNVIMALEHMRLMKPILCVRFYI